MIQLEHVSKVYPSSDGPVRALDDLTLHVDIGEFVAVRGPSGCGKSTLLMLSGGLASATSGKVVVAGMDYGEMSSIERAELRAESIGFVFQMFHLLPDMTALENVALPQLYAGKSEKEANKYAAEVLAMVELEDRIDHFPCELSGGEHQRVAIARALVNKPTILLADEPTGNLDSVTGKKIINLFKQLNQEHNVTVIIITHDQQLASETNRIITLHDGKITS